MLLQREKEREVDDEVEDEDNGSSEFFAPSLVIYLFSIAAAAAAARWCGGGSGDVRRAGRKDQHKDLVDMMLNRTLIFGTGVDEVDEVTGGQKKVTKLKYHLISL